MQPGLILWQPCQGLHISISDGAAKGFRLLEPMGSLNGSLFSQAAGLDNAPILDLPEPDGIPVDFEGSVKDGACGGVPGRQEKNAFPDMGFMLFGEGAKAIGDVYKRQG